MSNDLEYEALKGRALQDPSYAKAYNREADRRFDFDEYCEDGEPNAADPVLCYVEEPWAYFTTKALEKQWGDDWNDAPYEDNAGDPYEPHFSGLYSRDGQMVRCTDHRRDGSPGWRIVKVAYDNTRLETPAEHCKYTSRGYSSWTVEQINRGETPWLKTASWYSGVHYDVMAGTKLSDFIKIIKADGGTVYLADEKT